MPDDAQNSEHPPAPRPRMRASDADRDAVLDVLAEAHSAGRLTPDELDERQRGCLSARFLDELPALIDDLPEGGELAARLAPAPPADQPGSALAPRPSPAGEIVPARPGSGEPESAVAVFSGGYRSLSPGTPVLRCVSLFAGDDISLVEAMGPGVEVTLELTSAFAGHEIYVPPGVKIIDRTVNILAGNDIEHGAQGDGSNGTLILTGISLCAGHDVHLARGRPSTRADALER